MTKTVHVNTAAEAFEILRTESGPRTKPVRQCGDCQLCCRLLPMHDNEPWRPGPSIDKMAGERCLHQKFGKGCGIYAKRPFCCQMWNCRWLVEDAGETGRPDHSHLVIDVMPDFITAIDNETGAKHTVQVVQVWIDPKYPNAHRDPAFRRWLLEQAKKGIAALIRFNERDAITILAPPMNANGEWIEIRGDSTEKTHTLDEVANALGGKARMVITK
jgi:hypothetical protein